MINQIVRGLLFAFILYVAASVVVCWDLPKSIWSDWKKKQTVILLGSYKSVLNKYHDEYGSYPVACTNIEELLYVFEGHYLRGCNSNSINFFDGYSKMKRTHDGFGKRLVLIKNEDGTNLIIRSTGKCRFDGEGRMLSGWKDIDTATITKKILGARPPPSPGALPSALTPPPSPGSISGP